MNQVQSAPVAEAVAYSDTRPLKNIVHLTGDAGNFTKFSAGIEVACLTSVLSGKGPFTVFAPTDEAFEKLPSGAWEGLLKDPAKLKAVLSYHVVSGRFMAKDVKSGEVMTTQGTTLTAAVAFGYLSVNGARITKRDVVASNGLVHAINAVILPKDWQLLAIAA